MFKIILFIAILSITPSFLVKSQDKTEALFISEVSFAGSNLENNCQKLIDGVEIEGNKVGCGLDKWVEIANNSNSSINLQGYKIRLSYKDILIKDSFVIAPQTVGILATKNKNMTSSLDSLGLNIYKIGLLQGISSKEKSSLSVGLVSPENILLDSFVQTLEFGSQKQTMDKISGIWELSKEQFLPNNLGTPGKFNFVTSQKTDVLIPQITPILELKPNLATQPQEIKVPSKVVQKEAIAEILPEKSIDKLIEKTEASKLIPRANPQELNQIDFQKSPEVALEPKLAPNIQETQEPSVETKIKSKQMVLVQKTAIIMPKVITYQENNTLFAKYLSKNLDTKPITIATYSNNTIISQKEILGFSHTSFEQVLSLSFLTILSLLQKIIAKITKKCKPIFTCKLAKK